MIEMPQTADNPTADKFVDVFEAARGSALDIIERQLLTLLFERAFSCGKIHGAQQFHDAILKDLVENRVQS